MLAIFKDLLLDIETWTINHYLISASGNFKFIYLAALQGQSHQNIIRQLMWARIT